MNKRAFTVLFTIISTIINIILTLAVIIGLLILCTVVIAKVFHSQNGTVYAISYLVSFFGGMGLSLWLFVKLTAFVIEKFNLESKLDPKVVGKYVPGTGRKFKETYDEPKKRKTNMPSSVQRKEDTWADDVAEESAAAENIMPLNQEIQLNIPQSEEMTDENADALAAQNLFPLHNN